MNLVEVDSPDDLRLADFHGLRLREDRHLDHFVVEGHAAVRELAHSPYRPRAALVLDRKLERVRPSLAALDVPVYVAPEAVLRATLGFNLHRGVIASATREPLPDPDSLLAGARTVAVLERLNDHENLGSIFRNARALGVDAVLLDPQTADPLYRRCVRVSIGHVLRVPFARFDAWPDPAIDAIRARGFTIAALTPSPDAVDIADVPRMEKVAVVVGAEGPGLSPTVLAGADARVRIPMADGVDSLNVATAAAIAFHAFRRRSS